MSKQILNNGDSAPVFRGKLNDNFTELYDLVYDKIIISGKVTTYANLPDFSLSTNEYWIVNTGSGVYPFNRKPAGLYYSDGASWAYTGISIDYLQTDDNWILKDGADNTKQLKFQLDQISTGTQRTLIVPDSNGTLALTSDLDTIDHNTLINTHNLSTDIDHNNLNNYSIDQHFTQNEINIPSTQINDFNSAVSANTDVSNSVAHISSNGSSHTFIDQDLTVAATPEHAGIKLTPGVVPPPHEEGVIFYDDVHKTVAFYNNESDSTLQIGQELWLRAKNNTGAIIVNGSLVYINGMDTGIPTVALANASNLDTSIGTIAFATHNVEDGSIGLFTRIGTIRDLNTSTCTSGQKIWLDTTDGNFTQTKPSSPNYSIFVGTCGVVSATAGTIEAQIIAGTNTDTIINFWNGSILEHHNITVGSDGTTTTLTLDDGGANINLFFSGGFTSFSIPAEVTLTNGTDELPALNYVYIPVSTTTLTSSVSGFPAEQYVAVATVLLRSAETTASDGALKVHAWTDHLSSSSDQGHLSDINAWIRSQHATYKTGVDLTYSGVLGTSYANIDIATTAGTILQLHKHGYPAFNTSTGSDIHIVNDSINPYKTITGLNATDLSLDSKGNTLNNKWFNVVLWGVVSENDGDCHLMLNLPSGSYTTENVAAESTTYRDTSIPESFVGTGFLIAELTLRNSGGNITISTNGITDLRGALPLTAAGSGTGATITSFSDDVFKILDGTDASKIINFQVDGVSTGTTRTISAVDSPMTIPSTVQVSAIDANTSARHDAVTVTDSSEIDFTLLGQNITASLKPASIDETKLDVSVNNSLDLADSSLQDSDIGVSIQGYNANTTLQGVISLGSLGFTGDVDANNYTHPITHPPSIIAETTSDRFVSDTQINFWNGKEDGFAKNTAFNKNFGSSVDTVTQGNDARLSDARTPVAHTQTASTITDFDAEVSNNPSVVANTAKISFDSASSTKLAGIESGAEVNYIDGVLSGSEISLNVGVRNLAASLTTAVMDKLTLAQNSVQQGTLTDWIGYACSDETSDLEAGTAKISFNVPAAMTLTNVRANVTTAPTGSTLIVDINKNGSSILSTKLSIDSGEVSSVTAAIQAVISNTTLTDDDRITIDIDQVGATTPGAGLIVYIKGTI